LGRSLLVNAPPKKAFVKASIVPARWAIVMPRSMTSPSIWWSLWSKPRIEKRWYAGCWRRHATIIANIYGHSPDEYVELARRLEAENAADALELNLSCPNVHDARKRRGAALVAQVPETVALYTRAVRSATKLPLIVKLTPNVADICEPALAAQEAGADAISLINTLMGMAIDPETRRARLANIVGGLSGPAIRPVALKMVWDVARVVKIPVIGMGGICDASDAVQFLVAGATAVAVGSVSFRNPRAAIEIVDGIARYLERHHMTDIRELIGSLVV
jgi:dihydroorotate dehydrogenase (NAD+) catalytic subunit